MRKSFIAFLLPIFCYAGISEDILEGPTVADEITFSWLTQKAVEPHDTQHVFLFKKIFESMKIKTLLEFGLGYPTKYFLDHCNKVISVDIITHGYGSDVMKKFMRVYSDYSNWIPIAFFSGYLSADYGWAPYKHLGSESIYKATSYQHAYHKDYSKLDNFYLIELNAFINSLLKYNKTDIAFIGHAIILRGDIVQLLFDKVPLIVAHNSNKRNLQNADDMYGLIRVTTPENYEEIFFPFEGGTTIWISKQEKYKNLIEKLKKYAEEI
jgi:hypothetical protein